MANNKEPKAEDKPKIIRPFPKWVSILIVIISLLEVVFILSLFAISFFKHIPFCFFEKEAESSLLASGIAIIGVAVAVWAGLNIANAIERKEYEKVKESRRQIEKLSKKSKSISGRLSKVEAKQKSANIAAWLNELYKTNQDAATRAIIEKIRNIKTISNDKLLSLVEIERRFSSVYYLHNSAYSYDSGLLQEAADGISLAKKLLKEELEDSIQYYLLYRIAELNFYSGYCCELSRRKQYFDDAIKNYLEVYKSFGSLLPPFESFNKYSDIEYKKCDKEVSEISAYFCNSIGESYSKTIQIKSILLCTKEEIIKMEQQAIFYCGYAANWGNREVYWRNYGCAIERTYGITKDTPYDDLVAIYNRAFELQATKKSFKTLLSILQKYLAFGFDIGKADPDKGREIPLNDIKYFDYYSNSTSVDKGKMDDMLKELCNYSSKAKTIYPSDTVGYVYSCFYHIYMCIVNRNDRAEIDKHKALGNEDLQILKILAPDAALTKILGNDLAAF